MLEINLQIVKTRSCKNFSGKKTSLSKKLKSKTNSVFRTHTSREKVNEQKVWQNPTINKHLIQDKNVNVSIHLYHTSCFLSSSQKIIFFFFCVMQLITIQKRSNDQFSNEKHSNSNIRMLIIYMVSIISVTIFHLKGIYLLHGFYFARLLLH